MNQPPSNLDKLRGLDDSSSSVPAGPASPSSSSRPGTLRFAPQSPWSRKTTLLLWGAIAFGVVFSVVMAGAIVDRPAETDLGVAVESTVQEDNMPVVEPREDSLFDRPINIQDLAERVTNSTVLLYCVPGEAQGSGFLMNVEPLTGIDENLIITNHHVVEGCLDGLRVRVYIGDDYFTGIVEGWDPSTDTAVITAPDVAIPPLKAAEYPPQLGQWVMAVGSPEGLQETVSFGYITNVVPEETLITSDAVLGPGSSGGPLVDNQGRALGVNFGVLSEQANGISLASPIDSLCNITLECGG